MRERTSHFAKVQKRRRKIKEKREMCRKLNRKTTKKIYGKEEKRKEKCERRSLMKM